MYNPLPPTSDTSEPLALQTYPSARISSEEVACGSPKRGELLVAVGGARGVGITGAGLRGVGRCEGLLGAERH